MTPFPAYIYWTLVVLPKNRDGGLLPKARNGWMGGGWEGGLILAGERAQPVGERLFGLRSEVLTCICPSQTS